jgi:hypothetical protein
MNTLAETSIPSNVHWKKLELVTEPVQPDPVTFNIPNTVN